MGLSSSSPLPRVRVLIASAALDTDEWADWQAARTENPAATRIVLQKVTRPRDGQDTLSAGVGYQETLRWFGPVHDADTRRQIIGYAAAVLAAEGFPPPVAEILKLMHLQPTMEDAVAAPVLTEGVVFLSHAETDLLALELAARDLPDDFPTVARHSLIGLADGKTLLDCFGARRGSSLLAILRIHGTAETVPGLLDLIRLANSEGWGVVVISGVGGSAALLPRTADIDPAFAANLTDYFLAGGVANVTQALRYATAEYLRREVSFAAPRAMPAHGLYHPDLLVTDNAEWAIHRAPHRPTAMVLFYRAHVLSRNLEFVDRMIRALEARGFAAVGSFTSTLRDQGPDGVPAALSALDAYPDVVINTVNFPVFAASSLLRAPVGTGLALEKVNAPLLQAICCGTPRAVWQASARGLNSTEAAINLALPECDGRVITVPISFKENHRYVPDGERIARVADLAARFARLKTLPNKDKRIAIVLSNAAGKAQRIGGAVGLDTPASLLGWLEAMGAAGYGVGTLPETPAALMQALIARGSYDERHPLDLRHAWRMPRAQYVAWFETRPLGFRRDLCDMWGVPSASGTTIPPPFWRNNARAARRAPLLALSEPYTDDADYFFGGLRFGNVIITIQPPRGFGVDPEVVYHAPDLPPCHHYVAFYRWLSEVWQADALIHFGTHGTLEWLPGKSVALSADCAPDALLGDLPLFYPFVVNNPGEGAQAKRRTHAVIVDHLVPPLTHAETYGPLATLARLVEEYYRAEVLDPSKLSLLRRQIWDLVGSANLQDDLRQIRAERHGDHVHAWDERPNEQGIPRALDGLSGQGFAHLLEDLDAYLCDLGRAQIRGGLHVFGVPPADTALLDLMFAILRSPNGPIPSLTDATIRACGIDPAVLRDTRGVWPAPLAAPLANKLGGTATVGQIKTCGETLAREWLEALVVRDFNPAGISILFCSNPDADTEFKRAAQVDLTRIAQFVRDTLAPSLARTTDETQHLLGALNGAYVPAGAAGSPSRGMAHVLPTGRNFFTVDPRGLPTPAAWDVGVALARETLARHLAETDRWPERIALSIWGTPTMRTGGDDIAQALALLGVRPIWEAETRVARGLEIVPLAELGRPRIDVTLRVSGFFRDAFPGLMQLFDEAIQQVIALEEAAEDNFVRKHWLLDTTALVDAGAAPATAVDRAALRVFSTKPGAYGTGLAERMDSGAWADREYLADTVITSGGYAYSARHCEGIEASESFRRVLAGVDLVVQNQDNLEQDLFDSNEYFEFQGGLVAAVTGAAGKAPAAYFGDSSEASRPVVRTLQGEALRVYRSRVVNPKWLDAIQRHGYRGGLEMAATVDALFGFSATAGIVTDWMYEGIALTYTEGQAREFLQQHNPWALNAIVERLLEAEQRQLWNATPDVLARLRATLLDSEAILEDATVNQP